MPVMELQGVSKSYPGSDAPVLRGVDLSVRAGESTAIVGRSGSGKSTLLNILGLVDRASSGTHRCGGRDVMTLSDRKRSVLRGEHLGFVFQSFLLLDRLTAVQNVAEPLLFSRSVPPARERSERALDLLSRVDLGARCHERPTHLSGGEQQRVAIARALVRRPRLVLADEPTGSLDPETGRRVLALFRSLLAAENTAVVMVTHDYSVAATCDHVLELREGALLPAGENSGMEVQREDGR